MTLKHYMKMKSMLLDFHMCFNFHPMFLLNEVAEYKLFAAEPSYLSFILLSIYACAYIFVAQFYFPSHRIYPYKSENLLLKYLERYIRKLM